MKGAVCLVLLLSIWDASCSTASSRGVTNEDIRDAILSLAHMLRDSTDKLERHEYRERVLGDHVKRALSSLDKRQRTFEDNTGVISTTLRSIDDRLRAIEAKLTQSSEADKNVYTVDTVQDSMQGWMTSLESMMRNMSSGGRGQDLGVASEVRLDALEAALAARLDSVAAAAERLEAAVLRPTPTTAVGEGGWLEGQLVGQRQELADLMTISVAVSRAVASLPTREEVEQHFNTTQEQLQETKYELEAGAEKGLLGIQLKLDDSHKSLTVGQEDLHKTVSDAGVLAEGFYSDVQKSYEQLLKEVKGLAKVEQVMIQTADNVLDTKRRIEYGVHQILLEMGDLVKLQMKDLNTTVNKRFDNISFTILDNQNGGLTNLSSKIEYEISQVWRQIGIMYQQLTASAGALDRLQQQTDAYVNGSLQTMDSMEGKVVKITGKMGEVDDNLNYLLGRLSLVTTHFNEIKNGLGAALDSMKSSFKTVQEQIKDVGPGPNPIPSEETVSDIDNTV